MITALQVYQLSEMNSLAVLSAKRGIFTVGSALPQIIQLRHSSIHLINVNAD